MNSLPRSAFRSNRHRRFRRAGRLHDYAPAGPASDPGMGPQGRGVPEPRAARHHHCRSGGAFSLSGGTGGQAIRYGVGVGAEGFSGPAWRPSTANRNGLTGTRRPTCWNANPNSRPIWCNCRAGWDARRSRQPHWGARYVLMAGQRNALSNPRHQRPDHYRDKRFLGLHTPDQRRRYRSL